jgi:putative glutamine amidotransferase
VSGPRRGAAAPRLLVDIALRLAGAEVMQVGPGHHATPAEFQGVVITGGHDIEPVLYAQESEVLPRYDRERDEYESALIDEAVTKRIPLLGICRGAQLLNVRLGGDLHQDLRKHRVRTSHRRTILPLKTIAIAPGSRLAELIGAHEIKVNSLHQQAVDRLGDGLMVSARDSDSIVQAIEHPDFDYLIGTQWHPEFLIYRSAERRLFRDLVSAAARYCEDLPEAAPAGRSVSSKAPG